ADHALLLTGSFDEFAVYPTALTADQINAHRANDAKNDSTTTLDTASGTWTSGQTVSFSATVTKADSTVSTAPSGWVDLMDGATQWNRQQIGDGGTVSFTGEAISAGNHTITAKYEGDDNFVGSNSPPIERTAGGLISPNVALSIDHPATEYGENAV